MLIEHKAGVLIASAAHAWGPGELCLSLYIDDGSGGWWFRRGGLSAGVPWCQDGEILTTPVAQLGGHAP